MAATTLTEATTAAAPMPDTLQFTVVRGLDGRHAVTVSVGDLTVLTSRGSARVVAQQAAAVIEAHLSEWPESDGSDVGPDLAVAAGRRPSIPAQHP